jgi:PhnB protein
MPGTILTPHIACRNASEAVAFYQKALGATAVSVHKLPDGRVMHAEMNVDGARFFLVDEFPEHGGHTPQSLGGTPITLDLHVADADGLFGRAVAAGCTVRMPLQDMFWGDRYGLVVDPFGHLWSIATTIRQVSQEEMQGAMASMAACEG